MPKAGFWQAACSKHALCCRELAAYTCPCFFWCAIANCPSWLSYFWSQQSWLFITVSYSLERLCWRLKSSPGGHRLKSQFCPLFRNYKCLVLILLTAESPLGNLLPQKRDRCFTTQPLFWVKKYLHDICFPAQSISPSTSYNFSSKALSASDFLTGKIPSLSEHHGWRPSL